MSAETPMAVADPTQGTTWFDALKILGGGIIGSLSTLVAFRTKLTLNERDLTAHKESVKKDLDAQEKRMAEHHNDITAEAIRTERAFRDSLEALRRESDTRHEENKAQLRLVRRQQFITLKMIADIARASNADKRFDDEIWRALADGQEDP